MKIAFLNITQGKVNRGAETFVAEVGARLSQTNDVEIIGGRKNLITRWPIFWRLYIDPNGLQILWFTLKNIPKIIKEKYDIVIPINGGWQAGLVRLATWTYGGKMVIAGQSGIGWDDRNNLFCFPDCFVAISQKAQEWAQKANPFLKKIVQISNGVDLDKFTTQGEIIKTSLTKPLALVVSALVPSKQIDLVIHTIAKLDAVNLLVVGDGPLKDNLLHLGKEKLGNRFELKSISFHDMPKVYRAADVLIFTPQSTEAFGIVLVEALAANIPVVTIDDEIRRNIVGNAGIFIKNPKNTDKLAHAITKSLHTPWGNKPRNQAQNFSWDKISKEYEKLFNQLI